MIEDIFIKIINREVAADIMLETDQLIAFKDIAPQAPLHVLIVPKKRIATLNDAQESDAELLGAMILAAKKIAKEQGYDARGYRLAFNCNQDAGQSVAHIHLHLLAGRVLGWPPG